MVISHTYRYLFVELPRTGSTAISRELRQFYDGQQILRKHATYHDFLKAASPAEKQYFVFAGIRNPLDDAVSLYFKYKTDHRNQYTDAVKRKRKDRLLDYVDRLTYNYIHRSDADFVDYFKRFYKVPYNNWSELSHKSFNHIIRFEHLQDDFACVLGLLGITPKRPLPLVNKTGGKQRDYLAYYTPEIIPQAKRIFGPFMTAWNYEFPPEWGATEVPWWTQAEFEFFNVFRKVYWRHMKYRL